MKSQTILKTTLVALCVLSSLCASAKAQWKDNNGGNWNNPTSASIGNMINDRLWNRIRAKARVRDAGNAASKKTGDAVVSNALSPQIEAAVRFRSTGTELRTQAIADELSAGGTPESKKQMLTLLSTLLVEYEKAARAQGKPNDLALAITAALVYNSSIYNGTPEPEDSRILEIRNALAELSAEAGTFASMTDRQKQELYETAVISTMLAKAGYDESKKIGDKSSMAAYRSLAGQTLRALSGMSPEQINLGTGVSSSQSTGTNNEESMTATSASAAPIEHWVILRAFRDNVVAAQNNYNGKRLTIVGPVDFVLVENGRQVARMSVPAWSGLQMFCIFAVSQKAAVARIARDQRVLLECTVKGEVGGYSRVGQVDLGSSVGRLTLDNCVLK